MSCEYQYTKIHDFKRIFMRVTITDSGISAARFSVGPLRKETLSLYMYIRTTKSNILQKVREGMWNESAQKETPSIKVQADIICHMVMGSGLLVSI